MNIKKSVIVSAMLLLPAAAFAQNGGNSCAEAVEMQSNSTYQVDTSAADSANPISNFGAPFGSTQNNDRIYKFTANGATGAITVSDANYPYAVFLSNGCQPSGLLPLNAVAGAAGAPGSLALTDDIGGTGPLVDGTTYYVAVTGNPGGQGAADPARNGQLTLGTPTLPVTLQSFSID